MNCRMLSCVQEGGFYAHIGNVRPRRIEGGDHVVVGSESDVGAAAAPRAMQELKD